MKENSVEEVLELFAAQSKLIRHLLLINEKTPNHLDGLIIAKEIIQRCYSYSLSLGYNFKQVSGYEPHEEIIKKINEYLGVTS